MPLSKHRKEVSTPDGLVSLFLREVLEAGAGGVAGRRSAAELGDLAAEMHHCDVRDNLRVFFDSLIPYRRFGDFQTLASLPRPRPLQLHVEPHIFYGHFRAWLRIQGFDPARGELHRYEMRLEDAERDRALAIIRYAKAERKSRK